MGVLYIECSSVLELYIALGTVESVSNNICQTKLIIVCLSNKNSGGEQILTKAFIVNSQIGPEQTDNR